ncbi:MAG: HK97-gp10 family putative phage morphogenesis protein [Spirochaetota bacterium]
MSVERIVHIDMSKHTQAQAEKMIASATLATEDQAAQLAPVDTGNLRGSISHRFAGPLEGEVFTPVEYGPYIEYGTRKMKAQPYMRPAVDEVRKQLVKLWQQ